MTNQQKIDQEKIEPVDVERCQAESKEPHQPFRLGFLGGRMAARWAARIRCSAQEVSA